MTYDSPKQIRRRQQARNDAPRRTRQPREIKVMTDESWDRFCDFHLFSLNAQIWQRNPNAAGRHAQALVNMAIQRKACQLMRDCELSVWEAMKAARVELFGKEPV